MDKFPPPRRASALNSDYSQHIFDKLFLFVAQTSWFRAIALRMRKWGKKEGNTSHKVLAKVFKMRKWRKEKETRMHFFQTADAVETALGKDISQSGATFYLIYSNTSTTYLTLYLNIWLYSEIFLVALAFMGKEKLAIFWRKIARTQELSL